MPSENYPRGNHRAARLGRDKAVNTQTSAHHRMTPAMFCGIVAIIFFDNSFNRLASDLVVTSYLTRDCHLAGDSGVDCVFDRCDNLGIVGHFHLAAQALLLIAAESFNRRQKVWVGKTRLTRVRNQRLLDDAPTALDAICLDNLFARDDRGDFL